MWQVFCHWIEFLKGACSSQGTRQQLESCRLVLKLKLHSHALLHMSEADCSIPCLHHSSYAESLRLSCIQMPRWTTDNRNWDSRMQKWKQMSKNAESDEYFRSSDYDWEAFSFRKKHRLKDKLRIRRSRRKGSWRRHRAGGWGTSAPAPPASARTLFPGRLMSLKNRKLFLHQQLRFCKLRLRTIAID